MRTNIVIDDELMANAMKVAGTTTKKATVEHALRELVDRERRLRVLDLAGRIEMAPLDEIRSADAIRA